jgi:hypothetical protein
MSTFFSPSIADQRVESALDHLARRHDAALVRKATSRAAGSRARGWRGQLSPVALAMHRLALPHRRSCPCT